MKCKYEVKNIFPASVSNNEIKKEICRKLARIIVIEENAKKQGFKSINTWYNETGIEISI